MTTETELLRAVAADLDDRDAWQVYLDWLLEREDPRAELCRLQMSLEDADDEREVKELNTQINSLIDQQGETWLTGVDALNLPVRWAMHRGVVGHVAGTPPALAANARKILAAAPLLMAIQVEAWRNNSDRDLAPLAGSPLLARAREITLHGDTKRLTGWHHLITPEVRSLELSSLSFAAEDLTALVAHPWPHLEALKFTGCSFNKHAIDPLAKLKAPKLVRFDLAAGHLGPSLGAVLAALPKLRYLRIPGNEINSEALALLRPKLGQLTYLDLRGNALAGPDIAPLLKAIPRVSVLKLGGNDLGTEAVEAIAAWPGAKRLTWLDVAFDSDRGAEALANSEHLSLALERLMLGMSRLTPAMEHALLDAPRLANARIYAGKLLGRKKRQAELAAATKAANKPKPKPRTM